MEDNRITQSFYQYEAGKDYKRKIDLYNTVRQNERFYRGDQWKGVNTNGLSKPTFNIIKRVINYLISFLTSSSVSVRYTDELLPLLEDGTQKEKLSAAIELLNKNSDYRFEKNKIDMLVKDALCDAAISGDAVFYTFWDSYETTGQAFRGDFKTVLFDNVNFFVSDVNSHDIQTQEYIMLAGRDSVASLRREARANGIKQNLIEQIVPDENEKTGSSELSDLENPDESNASQKATFLIKFYRDENGYVCFEKSTKYVVIKSEKTHMKRYPIAYFSWEKTKGSFHGTAPITSLIDNQKYINKAYSMVMKHMIDTAFSKVVYDKSIIPEWSNEVGQAVGIRSGDVRGAVTTVGVGSLQNNYLELISMAINNTKELLGATDAALGEAEATNTSAIIALRESSNIPLENVRQNLYACIEDLALIWIEMMIEYYPKDRLIVYYDADGAKQSSRMPDFKRFKNSIMCAKIDVGGASRYSEIAQINTLDKLLSGGYIELDEYLSRLPDDILTQKDELIENYKNRKLTEKGGNQIAENI